MTPRLSILICSIPSRFSKAIDLYEEISEMVTGLDIEILMLTDNKKRTIGEKREVLKNISKGKYFMFVDDDDSLYSVEEIYLACENDVDVITFKNKSLNADGSTFVVTFGLKNEVEHNTENGRYLDINRPPFTQCAWNEKFKDIPFPAISYGEDWEWVKRAVALASSEIHIPIVLHGYNFSPITSEASTNSNKHWKNPNRAEVKRCVVNLSTGVYTEGQRRLFYSLPNENVILFGNEKTVGAPLHPDNPYAFKIYAIDAARDMGYNQILWFDASVYAVKDIAPVWNWLEEKGIFLEEAGHYLGQWCNDRALNYFGIKREDAMKMPMLSAGFIGFDFQNPISQQFYAEWKEAMLNGMFKGSWSDHRHDLSCASAIANLRGLVPLYSHGGQFFAYIGPGFGEPGEKVVCHLRGL